MIFDKCTQIPDCEDIPLGRLNLNLYKLSSSVCFFISKPEAKFDK